MARWGTEGERADDDEHEALERDRRRREDDDAAAERRDVEWATTSWHSLVAGSLGHDVHVTTSTGSAVLGRLVDHGEGWCRLDVTPGSSSVVVLLAHVVSLRARPRVAPPRAIQRPPGSVLRRWARMREPVSVELVDGSVVTSRVGHVLSDAMTLVAAPDPAAADGGFTGQVTVPLSAVVCLRGPRLSAEL